MMHLISFIFACAAAYFWSQGRVEEAYWNALIAIWLEPKGTKT